MQNNPSEFSTAAHREAVGQRLMRANQVAVISHVRPDGDAVGAVLGLGLALQEAGKTVQYVLADGVPANFRFLAGSGKVQRSIKSTIDCAVVVDCSDLQRTGGVLGNQIPDVNIDHHVTNLGFAHHNLVIPEAVATSAILAEMLPYWGFPITQPVATALLSGIVTDTIGFRTSNMTAAALRLSADLIEHGAHLPTVYTQALVSKTFEAARYWGLGLGKLAKEDGLVWTTLSLTDRAAAQYPGNDDADLVNVLSSIDTRVAVIFIEQKTDRVKVSWRAKPGIDVSQIALQFGGGGHAAAAGADIPGSLAQVQENVLTATRKLLSVDGETQERHE